MQHAVAARLQYYVAAAHMIPDAMHLLVTVEISLMYYSRY